MADCFGTILGFIRKVFIDEVDTKVGFEPKILKTFLSKIPLVEDNTNPPDMAFNQGQI